MVDGAALLREHPLVVAAVVAYAFSLLLVFIRHRPTVPSGTAPPVLIGHRGASASCPENTRAAFVHALERGAEGIECDVRLAANGEEVVVLHDASLHRTSRGRVNSDVGGMTYEEVTAVNIGSASHPEETVPTLSDLLELLPPGALCYVELKGTSAALVPKVLSVCRDSDVPIRDLRFIAFSVEMLVLLKAEAPECLCYALRWVPAPPAPERTPLLFEPLAVLGGWLAGLELARFAAVVKRRGLDGINLNANPRVVTPQNVTRVRQEFGLDMGVWVLPAHHSHLLCNDVPYVWEAMARAEVSWFTSNLGPEALAWWRARRSDDSAAG